MGLKEVLFSFLLATQKRNLDQQEVKELDFILFTFFMKIIFVVNCDTPLQVVQEYERAVIFRLGRLKQGGAKVQSKLP